MWKLLTEDASQRNYSSVGNVIAKGRNGPEITGVWILSLSPVRHIQTLLLAPSSRSLVFSASRRFPSL